MRNKLPIDYIHDDDLKIVWAMSATAVVSLPTFYTLLSFLSFLSSASAEMLASECL